jgi:hypothetical protein
MKAIHELPSNYADVCHIRFSRDQQRTLFVNHRAYKIALFMLVITDLVIPVTALMPQGKGIGALFLRIGVLIPMIFFYVILHEVVHGVCMKLLGCKELKYVFSGLYISAGCRDYFTKRTFLFIDLAPVVLLGILLNVICAVVPISWFWVFYILQIVNIAGASGDYFIAHGLFGFDKSVLVCDAGTYVTVYAPYAEDAWQEPADEAQDEACEQLPEKSAEDVSEDAEDEEETESSEEPECAEIPAE